jgi:hypothetical protein
VSQVVTDTIRGAPLVNYDGFVSVSVQPPHAPPLGIVDDRVRLTVGHEYHLVVEAGREPVSPVHRRVLIENGTVAEQVPFTVSIDSDRLAMRVTETPFPVPTDGGQAILHLALHIPELGRDPALWIRLRQRGRTLHVIELQLELVEE